MCSFPSFFFQHIRWNSTCLKWISAWIHLGIKVSANPDLRRFCIQVDVFFILFSSPFSTVRDAASFTASRPQAVFAFSSRVQRHTSRCYNQVSSHCQVQQCTGYTTRTVAAFSASRASDPNAFKLRYANIWRDLRWSSFHKISRWRRVGHSRHQTTRVTKTEALLWRVEVGRTNRTLTEENKDTNLWQLKTIKPLEGTTWIFLSSLIAIALFLSVSLSLLHSSDPSPSPHTPPLSIQAVFALIGRWNLCVHEPAMSILRPEDPGEILHWGANQPPNQQLER